MIVAMGSPDNWLVERAFKSAFCALSNGCKHHIKAPGDARWRLICKACEVSAARHRRLRGSVR